MYAFPLPRPDPVCALCHDGIELGGPAVMSWRPRRDPSGPWRDRWVPFVEDLRTAPQRLLHPRCFADDQGVDAMVGLVHAHDSGVREAEYRHWRASHGIQ
ncbi:MAG: hypothetical protein JWN57_2651 [Frankiales bacterium]|jgi:hypothetical protein|nr:hypothetical protein [Frankiales bacterium]